MSQRFSDRVGATTTRSALQVEEMDAALRNSIWNMLSLMIDVCQKEKAWFWVARGVAGNVLKVPADDPSVTHASREWMRNTMLRVPWWTVYNIIEYLGDDLIERFTGGTTTSDNFRQMMNGVFKQELGGYSFIGATIVPISNKVEKEAVAEALRNNAPDGFTGARTHLDTAVKHLSRKPTPDYRNSMKESISAVESAVRSLPGINETNFDKALRKLAKQAGIHPVLEQTFIKLYAYTSDEDGVRHAIIDDPAVGFEEAKFMLVTCSAFVNFLTGKTMTKSNGKRTRASAPRSQPTA